MAAEIIARLPASFEKAKASGSLFFFPSTTETITDSGVNFQIRICPALQHKPKLPTPQFDPTTDGDAQLTKKGDPFAPPYIADLHVGDLKGETEGDYVVLLNKYAVVPEHFLLVTREHESQQAPLYPSDLVQAYRLLAAGQKAGKPLYGFYNCGDLSGASQHHKHLQFMPVEDDGPPVEKLARRVQLETPDRPFALNSLPYANHVVRLPAHLPSAGADEQEAVLAGAFLGLLDLAISTIRHDAGYPAGAPSYNVLLTLQHVHVVPRRQENHVLAQTGEPVSVNACGFAGQLLVKSDDELEAVRTEGIGKILRGVALESVHDQLVASVTEDRLAV